MMNALDTYRKENKEKLAEQRLDMDREVIWREKHRMWQIIQLMELRKCIVPNDE